MNNNACPFCESLERLREYEGKFHKPEGFEYNGVKYTRSVAIVTKASINGRTLGRTVDYMRNGNGYQLNYCPCCGRRIDDDTEKLRAALAEVAQKLMQEA